jgi:hypothetical protein
MVLDRAEARDRATDTEPPAPECRMKGATVTFKDFCVVVSFTLFLIAGVVQLTTSQALSRTGVALALFGIGFFVLSRLGPVSFPTTKAPPPA